MGEQFIDIGNYYLEKRANGKIWINAEGHAGDEGGEFSEEELEKVIAKFYSDNF